MRGLGWTLCSAVVAVLGLSAPALAHGRMGGGRAGEVPPDDRDPNDPPPPVEWSEWWSWNRDELCPPRRGFAGRTVRETAAPALRTLLAGETESATVRTAAALALAKCGDETSVPTLRRLAVQAATHEIREAAAVAIGVAQPDDAETRRFLIDVVHGRGVQDVMLVRPFATVSLGLLGSDAEHTAAAALIDIAARDDGWRREARPSFLLALGALGDGAATPELIAIVRMGRMTRADLAPLNDIEVACAVESLGRLGGSDALEVVAEVVERRPLEPRDAVRRSAVDALGKMASRCDERGRRRIADDLTVVAGDVGADRGERRLALAALGRLGVACRGERRTRIVVLAFLRASLDGDDVGTVAFAALALGLVGSAIADEGGRAERDVAAPLREKLRAVTDTDLRAAYAVALGMTGAPVADASDVDWLVARLRGPSVDPRELAASVRDLVAAATDGKHADVSRATAIAALGRLGDDGEVPALARATSDSCAVGAPDMAALLSFR